MNGISAHDLNNAVGTLIIILAAAIIIRSAMWASRTDVRVSAIPDFQKLLDGQTETLKLFITENKQAIDNARSRLVDLETAKLDHSKRLREAERDLAILKRDSEWIDRILMSHREVSSSTSLLSLEESQECRGGLKKD